MAWRIDDGPVPYDGALAAMDARVAAIRAGDAPELVWLLEHPALYTVGTSAKPGDVPEGHALPVVRTGRGGQVTWHGPGQRIAYAMLDLEDRGRDIRCFVHGLEDWLIATLDAFGVRGERREGRVGVWVRRPDKGPGFEDKIAAIGVRVRRWVTFHGVSLNVDPDLSAYGAIAPCGIHDPRLGTTSLADLGLIVTMPEVDMALRAAFGQVFMR